MVTPKTPSKRVKREIQRSSTDPTIRHESPEREENKLVQRKSNRLRKSHRQPSPEESEDVVKPKREPVAMMKRPLPSSTGHKDAQPNSNQVTVKTDQRYYWCTKCSKIYLNLISLYTQSHYRQCVGENQHFNVIQDMEFFTNEDILQQLPSNGNNETYSSTSSNPEIENSRRKETIFFSKTSDESRTYFINGKPIRMNSVNRPITVKDLRQQFQQQANTTASNPSEEYVYQSQRSSTSKSGSSRSSRPTETSTRLDERQRKMLPTPRSLDRFGISSDEDENDQDSGEEKSSSNVKPIKTEVEKTLVKRRYDSDYSSTSNTVTSIGTDHGDSHSSTKQIYSRKSQPVSRERVRIHH